MDGWMNQAYSRLSTTHGHITDCKLLVCVYWTRLVLVRPVASLYSASPLKHHPTGKQWCPNPDHNSDSEPARRSLTLLCRALSRAAEPQILTSFVWRGRASNHQSPACQANPQPPHYPAAVSFDSPFSSYRPFWDKWNKLSKSNLEHYKVKNTTYMCCTTESQISLHFAPQPAVFEVQNQKSEIHWMTSKLHETSNCYNYPIYIRCLTPLSNFGPFHSMTGCFQDIALL